MRPSCTVQFHHEINQVCWGQKIPVTVQNCRSSGLNHGTQFIKASSHSISNCLCHLCQWALQKKALPYPSVSPYPKQWSPLKGLWDSHHHWKRCLCDPMSHSAYAYKITRQAAKALLKAWFFTSEQNTSEKFVHICLIYFLSSILQIDSVFANSWTHKESCIGLCFIARIRREHIAVVNKNEVWGIEGM